MSDTIKIKVRNGSSEIIYEQSTKESLSFAPTATEGYSKRNSQEQLMKTISTMCDNVKKLGEFE